MVIHLFVGIQQSLLNVYCYFGKCFLMVLISYQCNCTSNNEIGMAQWLNMLFSLQLPSYEDKGAYKETSFSNL